MGSAAASDDGPVERGPRRAFPVAAKSPQRTRGGWLEGDELCADCQLHHLIMANI